MHQTPGDSRDAIDSCSSPQSPSAEHRFNAVFESGRAVEAGRNAHGRCKFRNAEDTQPVLAVGGGAIYGEEEKAQKLGLVGAALKRYRQRHMPPLIADFEKWRTAVAPTLLPSEALAAAIRHYDNHHDAVTDKKSKARV